MVKLLTHPNANVGGDQAPKGQNLVAEAQRLLNRLEFDSTCGAAMKGEHVLVSVMPIAGERSGGEFDVAVACHARTPQVVTWSTLRVYASPKGRVKFAALLGPSLNQRGQATIRDLAAEEYELRAYHRAGQAPLMFHADIEEDLPIQATAGDRGETVGEPQTQWTSLVPVANAADGITLHRSVCATRLRIVFSSEDTSRAGTEVEFCLVVRETGEQLGGLWARYLERVPHEGDGTEDGGVACRTQPIELTVEPGREVDVCYRVVLSELQG